MTSFCPDSPLSASVVMNYVLVPLSVSFQYGLHDYGYSLLRKCSFSNIRNVNFLTFS